MDYEAFVDMNANYADDINYSVVGLNGEAGEVSGAWKHGLQGKDYIDEMFLELGDTLYYLIRTAHLHGWTLKDIQEGNMQKLIKRGIYGKEAEH